MKRSSAIDPAAFAMIHVLARGMFKGTEALKARRIAKAIAVGRLRFVEPKYHTLTGQIVVYVCDAGLHIGDMQL